MPSGSHLPVIVVIIAKSLHHIRRHFVFAVFTSIRVSIRNMPQPEPIVPKSPATDQSANQRSGPEQCMTVKILHIPLS